MKHARLTEMTKGSTPVWKFSLVQALDEPAEVTPGRPLTSRDCERLPVATRCTAAAACLLVTGPVRRQLRHGPEPQSSPTPDGIQNDAGSPSWVAFRAPSRSPRPQESFYVRGGLVLGGLAAIPVSGFCPLRAGRRPAHPVVLMPPAPAASSSQATPHVARARVRTRVP